jgi:hypothetical protein
MASFNGNDVIISGSLIVSGSSKIIKVPKWDFNQVYIGTYPPAGSLMEIDNLTGGSTLFYSDGSSFWLVELI